MAKQRKSTKETGLMSVGPVCKIDLNSSVPILDQMEAQKQKYLSVDRPRMETQPVSRSLILTVVENLRKSCEVQDKDGGVINVNEASVWDNNVWRRVSVEDRQNAMWMLYYLAIDGKELKGERKEAYERDSNEFCWYAVNNRELSAALQRRHKSNTDEGMQMDLRRMINIHFAYAVRYLDKKGKMQTDHVIDTVFAPSIGKGAITAIGVRKKFLQLYLEDAEGVPRFDYIRTYSLKQIDSLGGTPVMKYARRKLFYELCGLTPRVDHEFSIKELWSAMFPRLYEQRRTREMEDIWGNIINDFYTIGLFDNLLAYQRDMDNDKVCFRIEGFFYYKQSFRKRKK